MKPSLADVLATLAHEIRTPLSVSQGYVKLALDGRLADPDAARRAMDQASRSLGTLAGYCADMERISSVAGRPRAGVPERLTSSALLSRLHAHTELPAAIWQADTDDRTIEARPPAHLLEALATVVSAATTDAAGQPVTIRTHAGDALTLVAGPSACIDHLLEGPDGPLAIPLNVARGGHGLRLIWAAFVLDSHGAHAWSLQQERGCIAVRLPWA